MQQKRSLVRNRRGAALVIVAIALSALLSMLALAIDLGMLYKTPVEAQRAADAGALSGASVFMELAIQDADKVDSAYARAHRLAEANYMTGGLVVSGEVTVQVIPDSEKVRVWVKRDSVPTWFARIFGIDAVPIGAKAAAEATKNGTAKCLKPFLIPDFWEENTGDDALHPNQIWDFPEDIPNRPGTCGTEWECWSYDPAVDHYASYDEPTYGGRLHLPGRADRLRIQLPVPRRLRPPGDALSVVPPVFADAVNWYLWRIDCPGADCVRDAMTGCTTTPISVDDYIANEQPGEARGAVQQGLEGWMAQDPTARFVESDIPGDDGFVTGSVVSDNLTLNGDANPRVFIAGLISPDYLAPWYDEVPLNNLGKFFLESIPPSEGSKDPVRVRFLGFVTGTGDEGPTEGSLIKFLHLVE
jgi:hypothetical protein